MKTAFFLAGAAMLMLGPGAIAQKATAGATAASPSSPKPPAVNLEKMQAARRVVQEGWAKYDKGNDGVLTPLEFGTWVMAAQGEEVDARTASTRRGKRQHLSVKVLNATAAAFAKAGANHDHLISPAELTSFLAG